MLFSDISSGGDISFHAAIQKTPQPFCVSISGEHKPLVMAAFDLQELFGRNSFFIDFPAVLKGDYLVLLTVDNQLGTSDKAYFIQCCIIVFRYEAYRQPWIILSGDGRD